LNRHKGAVSRLIKQAEMILDKETADKKLRRMALEVAERNDDATELILIGIKENGIFIAEKIAAYLKEIFPHEIKVLDLSIDKKQPGEIILSEKLDFNGKTILLIDDVANSGRTILYALKPLLDHLPKQVQTLALVERTHKKFPIAMDYVGLSISTTREQNIIVEVKGGEIEGAYLG
jgi:pyrimidine operon attenuation protein / uracil phosphoribosyltransferase